MRKPTRTSAPAASVRLERLQLHGWSWQTEGCRIAAARVCLRGLAARPAGHAGAALPFESLTVGEVDCQGVEMELRAPLAHAAGWARAAASGAWHLDALGGLHGFVHAFITDALWKVDAEVRVPVAQGTVDFDQVTVAHIGPDSSMGLSRGGLYVDARHGGRQYLYLWTEGEMPGATYEQRDGGGRSGSRGRLDVRRFVHGVLAGGLLGAGSLPGRPAHRRLAATLDRTRLNGELQLGDGALGSADLHLVLEGHGQGSNKVVVSAAVVSHKLLLRLPELRASQARGRLDGRGWRCGAVSADLSVKWTRSRDPHAEVLVVHAGHLTLRDLAWPHPEPGQKA
ncbi:hypothetical protein [Schlegelella aquatica]|uniref:hypothetical protein n=1 Tax=Caldimonas aquatica TaxID=376175 RepID=UPI003751A59B